MNADDYGTVPFPPDYSFTPIPNSPNGGFYGYQGMADNFCALLDQHPVYVDPLERLCCRWRDMLANYRRDSRWDDLRFPYDSLKPEQERYNICLLYTSAFWNMDLDLIRSQRLLEERYLHFIHCHLVADRQGGGGTRSLAGHGGDRNDPNHLPAAAVCADDPPGCQEVGEPCFTAVSYTHLSFPRRPA